MRALNWPSLDEFSHKFCRRQRIRWGVHLHTVSRTAKVSADTLLRWETGRWQNVTTQWRAEVYAGLSTAVIAEAKKLVEVVEAAMAHGDVSIIRARDGLQEQPPVGQPTFSGFLRPQPQIGHNPPSAGPQSGLASAGEAESAGVGGTSALA